MTEDIDLIARLAHIIKDGTNMDICNYDIIIEKLMDILSVEREKDNWDY